jgi:hypothetical protein
MGPRENTMTSTPRHHPSLLLALLLATACGSVVDPTYPGEPLATLEGQMSVAPEATIDGTVRMALAWYPGLLAQEDETLPAGPPQAIVTEEVVYETSFPVSYRFNVYRPPPTEALVPLGNGVQGKGAIGVLLVYQDRNDNTQLDTIPAEGTPVDKVLGASLMWTVSPAWLVLYLDSEQAPETGLSRGFNLVKVTNARTQEVVPLSTRIPIVLSGELFLDALVCEAGFGDAVVSDPCGLGFDNPEQPVESDLYVSGSLRLHEGRAAVELTVKDARFIEVRDAQVTLAGQPIPFHTERGVYSVEDLGETRLAEGVAYTLRIVAGDTELVRELTFPTGFERTTPAPGTTVKSGAPLLVRWTAPPGARDFVATLLDAEGSQLALVRTTHVEETFEVGYVGPARLVVEGWFGAPDNEQLGWLDLIVVRETPLTFVR